MGVKVMIVDDSPFSRTLLTSTLQEQGHEVVGEAGSMDSLIETYSRCNPDIVTMDIAMPGADGFECSRTLLVHDPNAKIILVSSIKDEEAEAEARRIGVSGYVQKPVDSETLLRVIDNVMSPDTLYENQLTWGLDIFKEALSQSATRMTKAVVTFAQGQQDETTIFNDITVVIGIIGRYSGSMILDFSLATAEKMTEIIMHRPAQSQDEIVAMAAEFANIVAGTACSLLNKKEKAFGLRIAPPNVFFGTPTEIACPSIDLQTIHAAMEFGECSLSFGFKRGSVLWM